MTTLHKNRLNSNHYIQITNTGGNFTADGGLSIVVEYLYKIGLFNWLDKRINFNDPRKFMRHTNSNILKQLLLQLIAGYQNDSSANVLQYDPGFKLILNRKHLASQPTISRFFKRMTSENIDELCNSIQLLVDLVIDKKNQQEMIIDVDSTHTDTYGNQENTNYNAHYQTTGYHPLIAFDGVTGMLLSTRLRPGNVYTSNGIKDFMNPVLEYYRNSSCDMKILVRGDSGFASPELYQLCEQQKCQFLVKLKANHKLKEMAAHSVSYDVTDTGEFETQYLELKYQPDTWAEPYRVLLKATRPTDELLFKCEFLVTNLYSTRIEDIFNMYHNRGVVENSIKEIKDGFFMNKTDSSSFQINSIRMILSALAFNIIQSMKCLVLPATESCQQISTLRLKLFRLPAKIINHARNQIIQLSKHNVYDSLFWKVLNQVQQI